MKFSCSVPLGHAYLNGPALARTAQAMDRAGMDGCYVTDHPAPSSRWVQNGGHGTLDPFVALTYLACASPRLMLQTYILVLAYRNPFVVAKSAASLDALSGGRFIMGIGTGYLKPEYAAVGVPFDERGPLTDEAIAVMRQAWSGQPVAYKGTHFEARDAMVLPTPVQNPLPIWAGGNAPRAIRRAVELCEGWCPFPAEGIVTSTARTEELSNVTQLREKIAYAHDHAASVGRTRPLTVCIGRFRTGQLSPATTPSTQQVIDDYAELAAAGVTWTMADVVSGTETEFAENVQWFGEEIASKLREV